MRRRQLLCAAAGVCAAVPGPAALAQATAVSFTPVVGRVSSNPASGEASSLAFAGLWAAYRKQFVREDGRVLDTGNKDIVHTESLGVSMLLAVAAGDRQAFEAMHRFSKRLLRPDGLRSWRWSPTEGVSDPNNAADGDLYLAWAMSRAATRWHVGSYLQEARATGAALRQKCVVRSQGHVVLLPAAAGFVHSKPNGEERAVLNPSYWVYPALSELGRIDPGATWTDVATSALRLTNANLFGPRRLPADWLLLDEPTRPWSERPPRFGYEAIRVPLFLLWGEHVDSPALASCERLMRDDGFYAWYSLQDLSHAEYRAPAGFVAVGRLLRAAKARSVFSAPALTNDYYSSSLVLLSALCALERGLPLKAD